MGPPPADKVANERYNYDGRQVLYLCDSIEGVAREMKSREMKQDQKRVWFQGYTLPLEGLCIADFRPSPSVESLPLLNHVFWWAEIANKEDGTKFLFSQFVAGSVANLFDCLHAGTLREINEQNNRGAGSLRGISWVYDTRLLERSFADLSALDSSHSSGPLLLLWEPPSLDFRIANQSGLLSLMNNPDDSQNTFLHTHSNGNPGLVLKIVIEAQAKSEVRDMLDQNGISERTMFPGLPGLCDWLRRYFGKAW